MESSLKCGYIICCYLEDQKMEEAILSHLSNTSKIIFFIDMGLQVYEAYESPLLEIKNPKGFKRSLTLTEQTSTVENP